MDVQVFRAVQHATAMPRVIVGHDAAVVAWRVFGDSRLLVTPELLEHPVYAAMSAAWFWHRAGLNTLADKGDFLAITKRINGGTNGLEDRTALYRRALEVLQ